MNRASDKCGAPLNTPTYEYLGVPGGEEKKDYK